MVVDRLMFWLFTAVSLVGTFGVIIQSPTLYDDREPIYTKNWPAVTSAMTSRGHLRVRACVRDFDVRCASSNAKSTVNASTRRQCSQVAEFWNVEVWLVQTGIADPVVPDHRYDVATSHFSDSTLLLARWPVGRLGLLPNKQRRDGANDRERKCADTLAQCRFPGLAISNAKILIYLSNNIYTEGILSFPITIGSSSADSGMDPEDMASWRLNHTTHQLRGTARRVPNILPGMHPEILNTETQ